jgi:WASH complex subunit strumpellin
MKIMDRLKSVVAALEKVNADQGARKMLQNAYSSLKNMGSFSDRYENILNSLKKNFKNLSDFLNVVLAEIGQYVLLRDMICLMLRMMGKTGSPRLCLVLNDLNEALLSDMCKNQFVPETPENQEQMINDNLILALTGPYFAHMGMLDPMKKVYITCAQS